MSTLSSGAPPAGGQAAAAPTDPTFALERVAAGGGPLMAVETDADGVPVGATVVGLVRRPVARVWDVVADVPGYAGAVPMLVRVRQNGDLFTVRLRFGLAVFSIEFEFVARARVDEGRGIELAWVSGEPRDVFIRLELQPTDEAGATQVRATVRFDVASLGWLVKVFLRYHPEIRFGVVPGAALVLFDGLRRRAEAR